jgi:hypothetical protein
VDGRLLKADLTAPLESVMWRDPQAVFAAARFQATKSGPITLRFSGAADAPVWVDGKSFTVHSDLQTKLEAGTHTLYVKLNAKNLPDTIRVESPDAAFLPN